MNDTLEIAKKCGLYECLTVNYPPQYFECELQSFREEIEKLERERIISSYQFFNSDGKWLAEAIRKG